RGGPGHRRSPGLPLRGRAARSDPGRGPHDRPARLPGDGARHEALKTRAPGADTGRMDHVRSNECPHCGYAYSAWATPRAPLSERMQVSFSHRPGLLGLGHARAAMELEKMPWT